MFPRKNRSTIPEMNPETKALISSITSISIPQIPSGVFLSGIVTLMHILYALLWLWLGGIIGFLVANWCRAIKTMNETIPPHIVEALRKADAEVTNEGPTSQEEVVRLSKEICDLVLGVDRDNQSTAYPFWVIAVKAGAVGGIRIVSEGLWFSGPRAQEHLENKAHRYPKSAFVYCESAHNSYGGLRYLYDLTKELRKVLEKGDVEKV